MADGVDHLNDLMAMLTGCGLFLTILDIDEVCAVWRSAEMHEHGCFYVTRAFASGSDLNMALLNGITPLRGFSVRTPHVMGCFAGDVLTIDDNMSSQIANNLHDMIEDGVLVGQEIVTIGADP